MDNSDKIAKLQAEIAQLQREQEAFDNMPPEEKFATGLHELLCKWNHTDGCSWFYEVHRGIDDWRGTTHQSWLGRAKRARELFNETDDEILNIIRKVGKI